MGVFSFPKDEPRRGPVRGPLMFMLRDLGLDRFQIQHGRAIVGVKAVDR